MTNSEGINQLLLLLLSRLVRSRKLPYMDKCQKSSLWVLSLMNNHGICYLNNNNNNNSWFIPSDLVTSSVK